MDCTHTKPLRLTWIVYILNHGGLLLVTAKYKMSDAPHGYSLQKFLHVDETFSQLNILSTGGLARRWCCC